MHSLYADFVTIPGNCTVDAVTDEKHEVSGPIDLCYM